METYKNVSQDIRDQLNAKAEAVQIILTGIYNDIYSTVDACPNACEMWKAIERLKQGESINVQDLETNLYWEFGKFTSQDGESLESYYSRFYKMINELIRNQCNVAGAKENVGTPIVQKSRIQCYNCKEYGHVARECQKPKQAKDAAYHKEKMLLCKREEARFQLNTEQADWKDDTNDESDDQKLEAHYMYMEKLQEVTPDAVDNSGPIFNTEPVQQIKLYKSRKDKEIDKVIALENKVKVLDNIVYKTGQSVQTMNMLNSKCRMSFAKPEFFKKAQRANPRLYDIGCYNDNLALMLAPEFDEVIRLETESRSKLSDLIRPFDYEKLNNLYDLFVPQCEKSSEQIYFSERSRMSHTSFNNGNSKESFNKQTTLLETRMDESTLWDQKCKSSKELFKIKRSVGTIFYGVERCKEKNR
nr:hypothetical protein [Tanacetum cinerariifolium]